MTNIPDPQATDSVPTYMGRGDPARRFADYYPAWVDKLASDVTLEGSLLDGAVQGADAVRAVIGGARRLYDHQDFNFAGPWGEDRFIEDYTAQVGGRPIGAVHLITFNAAGQAQHIAANYRPLSSVMFFSRLLRERFAGTSLTPSTSSRVRPRPTGPTPHLSRASASRLPAPCSAANGIDHAWRRVGEGQRADQGADQGARGRDSRVTATKLRA
jgi:hypothetical protein